ncbi:MAG: hypothetical protein AB7V50_11425 [Vampirovibrionia bacterium]
MYKNKIFITIISFLIIIPQISIADSFSFKSVSKIIEPNKNFTLSVYVVPSVSNIYTVQANINFPADLVSVESFTYANTWFPMNQTGYDLIDNASGKLIKTAGYPSGFNKETLLGTVIFKAKKAGSISISINKESFILDMDSNNILNSYDSFSINSVTPTPTPTPVSNSKPESVLNPISTLAPEKESTLNSTPEVDIVSTVPLDTNENIYKKNTITNILFLFTGVTLIDKIVETLLGII